MVSRPKIRELFIWNFFTVCEDIYLNDKCTDQLISQTIYLSLMDWMVSICWSSNTQYSQNVTAFGGTIFKEIIKLEWGH